MSQETDSKPSVPVRRRRSIKATPDEPPLSAKENAIRRTADLKARFLIALEEKLGIVTYAAAEVGIHRRTVYDWQESDPDFARAVREIDNRQLDFVEAALLKNIKDGCTRAQTFYLSTKGRARGYTTRVEISGPQEGPIRSEVSVNVDEARSEMSDKAMSSAMKALMRANPGAFTESTRIAIANGEVDKV